MSQESRPSILIVETDPLRSAVESDVLRSAGFRITCASSFAEAKRLIAIDPPDILITGLRLGEYNGLHLVLRTRMEHPQMSAIVTSDVADRVLEAEAERQSAAFLVRPLERDRLLRAVRGSLNPPSIAAESTSQNVAG